MVKLACSMLDTLGCKQRRVRCLLPSESRVSGTVSLAAGHLAQAIAFECSTSHPTSHPAVGSQARLMSSALRKLTANASKCNCTIIFLNQLRMKIGVIYGNPEITSGGNALKFYSSVRVDVRRKQQIEGPKGDGIGVKVKAKVGCPVNAVHLLVAGWRTGAPSEKLHWSLHHASRLASLLTSNAALLGMSEEVRPLLSNMRQTLSVSHLRAERVDSALLSMSSLPICKRPPCSCACDALRLHPRHAPVTVLVIVAA